MSMVDSDDETYATWLASLWFLNDAGLYFGAIECGKAPVPQQALYDLASQHTGLMTDLTERSLVLLQVDWAEVAQCFEEEWGED